jgi:hypothetical protein
MDQQTGIEEYMRWMQERYYVGLVTFHTAPEKARDFARVLSTIEVLEEGEYYLILGVGWAAAMQDGSTVVAAVRTKKPETLEDWMADIEADPEYEEYELHSDAKTVDRKYKQGKMKAVNDMP